MSKSCGPAGTPMPGMRAAARSSSRSSTGCEPSGRAVRAEPLGKLGQELCRNAAVHQADLLRVADAGAAGFGVLNDVQCLGLGRQLSSTKMWQMPVPVWMQGTLAFSTQARMSPAPPRGMSRST